MEQDGIVRMVPYVCEECGGTNFLEGPHGGLAVNFCCGDCWARYNDSVFSIDRHGWVDGNERDRFRKTEWFPITRADNNS